MANEAIAAIATPPGRGGIGVVRISGANLGGMLHVLTGKHPPPRQAVRVGFRDGEGALIDQGLAIFFPQPRSYTGEDVIELHAHGGPIVLQLLLRRCLELGARAAEPGEFTKRAFLNDKLDLAQAESVADLIDASTIAAARCAVRSLQGEFSQCIGAMVAALVELRALVEASIDFPDEDLEFVQQPQVRARLDGVRHQLAQVLEASRRGSLLREGIHVVLAGRPNVGKSSLLNRLAGEDVAIVTALPGTTRDAIHQSINVRGVPLHFVDTAGLREARNKIEKIGISRTYEHISKADLVVWLSDVTRPETRASDAALAGLAERVPRLHVVNKIDLAPAIAALAEVAYPPADIEISAATGLGIELLKDAVLDRAGWVEAEGTFMARERHLNAIRAASAHLARAPAVVSAPELFAEELRLAQRELVSITGEYTADELIGEIFSKFCIGK